MNRTLRSVVLAAAMMLTASAAFAQSVAPVDRMFRISGALPPGTVAGAATPAIRFAIYDAEADGTLLWEEVQALAVDAQGRYTVLLGATSTSGLPVDLFAGGAPRWLHVQAGSDGAAPRTLLTSVPYALTAVSAANADSLGGRPATDYLLSPSARAARGSAAAAPGKGPDDPGAPNVNSGTTGYIGKFFNTVDLNDSALFQSGSSIGLGTTSPLDVFHSRFTNTNGIQTGLAVQNLGGTTSSYSGMLFYDHTGTLRQFQGYNNGTGEYRINNVSPTGSINFMIGSTSRLQVSTNGNVGIGNAAPESTLHIGNGGNPILKIDGEVNSGTDGPRLRFTETFSSDYGFEVFADGNNDRLIFRGLENDAVTAPDLLVIDRLGARNVGIGVAAPQDKLHVAGDVRVGTGTTGCVRDADATVIAGTCSSDLRFKRDVTPFAPLLDRFAKLSPVNYFWRASEFPSRHFGTKSTWGLIAQDVDAVFPDLVAVDEHGYLAVNYSKLPLLTVQAVKELKLENDALKERNADLESRLTAVEAALKSLTTAIQQQR